MPEVVIKDMGIPKCPALIKVANIQAQLPNPGQVLDERLQMKDVPEAKSHESKVLQWIDQALQQKCHLIVLPELATSERVEKAVLEKLQTYPNNTILVLGSYYRDGYNRSPILLKLDGKVHTFYQEKFFPSALEKGIMKEGRERLIFVNTGLGDFAVFICYEANDWTIFSRMEKLVDFLVVIAYNKATGTFRHYFTRACYEHYYAIVYCNDGIYGDSSFFLPYKDADARQTKILSKDTAGIAAIEIPLGQLDTARLGRAESLNNVPLAYAPANITSYGRRHFIPERRKLQYFQDIIAHQEGALLPIGLKAKIELLELVHANCQHCQTELMLQQTKLSTLIERKEFKIGRSEKNDLIIPAEHKIVSGEHAIIQYKNQSFFFKDQSTYNSLVGGTILTKGQEKKLDSPASICLAPNKGPKNQDEKDLRIFLNFRQVEIGEEETAGQTMSVSTGQSQGNEIPCPHCSQTAIKGKTAKVVQYKMPDGQWKSL